MADRTTLGVLGFIFCGIAATVITVAYLVVSNHIEGRLVLGDNARAVYAVAPLAR
jgi:hypothetical protein